MSEISLAGTKGHVSTMDWRAGKLQCELQLQETVRDVCFLHNDQYFATAQAKYVFVSILPNTNEKIVTLIMFKLDLRPRRCRTSQT